jgi:hypothetical protein
VIVAVSCSVRGEGAAGDALPPHDITVEMLRTPDRRKLFFAMPDTLLAGVHRLPSTGPDR